MSTISIFNRKYYCKFFVSLSRCLLFLLVFVKLLIASRVENYVGIINVLKYKSDKNANYCKSCEREDETNLFLKFATATGYWFVFFTLKINPLAMVASALIFIIVSFIHFFHSPAHFLCSFSRNIICFLYLSRSFLNLA